MNETDLNNLFDDDPAEYRQLLWEQLEPSERTTMKMYVNNLVNNKVIHPNMVKSVNLIMERYTEFDVLCVP